MINLDNVLSCNDLTNRILQKMHEKEKKPEKKPAPPGTAKGMKRNKTTINLGRNKLDKKEKSEKAEDNRMRKSTITKNTHSEMKKDKPLSMSMSIKIEPKEKKEASKKKRGQKR